MHLDAEARVRLITVASPDVLEHLLDCARCRVRLRNALDPEAIEPLAGLLIPPRRGVEDQILQRAAKVWAERDKERESETANATTLYDQLLTLPPDQREEILEQDSAFQSIGLARLLLAAGEAAIDPNLAFHLAHLALTILDRLEEANQADADHLAPKAQAANRAIRMSMSSIPTLRILASCLIAESQRRKGNVETAEDILKSAAAEIQAELSNSPVRFRFCRILAAVRADQFRVDEALALLERAASLCEEHGAFDELALCRLVQGELLLEESDQEGALTALRAALVLLDPAAYPQRALATLHALALTCADLGRRDLVKQVLEALAGLRDLLPDRLDALRVRWIRAQVQWRLGQERSAIERLHRVFSALIEERAPAVETATAALELARMHVEGEAKNPAANFNELLTALRPLARQGTLASPLWSVTSFALTFAQLRRGYFLEILDSAIRYLRVAQFNPELPFHPLAEPDQVLAWSDLPKEQRRAATQAAGIEPSDQEPSSLRQRTLAGWSHEALTGVRVRFSEDDRFPVLEETLPS